MSLLEILTAPDPRLKRLANAVPGVDETLRRQMDDMLETMYRAEGIGLAATQVGLLNRVIVIDLARTPEERQPLFFANPEIVWSSEDMSVYNEGCLSVPEHYAEVERPAKVCVKFLDYNNAEQEALMDGLLATCIQHEIDHLNGVLFIDHLSSLKKDMIVRKLKKAKKGSVVL